MIHQIGLEFPQDHEYAIQKNPTTNSFRVIAQKTVIMLGLTRLG